MHQSFALIPQVTHMPKLKNDREIAEWLVDLRNNAGLRQDEVDRLTRELGHRISQSYLSQLERGIKPLASLDGDKMNALRTIYRVPPTDWVIYTGLTLVLPTSEGNEASISLEEDEFTNFDNAPIIGTPGMNDAQPHRPPLAHGSRGYRGPVPPRLPPIETPLEIPPALQEAIDQYGDTHPEMRIEANQRAVASINRLGGNNHLSPSEWFDVFMANRRWLVKP